MSKAKVLVRIIIMANLLGLTDGASGSRRYICRSRSRRGK
jgi:hypothetical protein